MHQIKSNVENTDLFVTITARGSKLQLYVNMKEATSGLINDAKGQWLTVDEEIKFSNPGGTLSMTVTNESGK